MLPIWSVYPIYTGVLALIMVVLIPREKIKQLLIYGIIFGGVFDIFWILLIGFLELGGYKNFGPFGFLGIPFFPPIAWTIYFVIHLYFLPRNNLWPYFFAVITAFYDILFSNVLANFNIFEWIKSDTFVPLIIYQTWHISVVWGYLKLKDHRNRPKQFDE